MLNFSVLDYLGKINNCVLVHLGIVYNNKYYEGTYCYNSENGVLTFDDELENELKLSEKYFSSLIDDINKKVVPYYEIIDTLDYFDINKWAEEDIIIEETESVVKDKN